MPDVLVVGSVALDDIEVPTGGVKGVLGGAATYFALASRYFARVRAVGVAGSDFPREHLDFLGEAGIDLEGVATAEGPTFRWGGRYDASLSRRDTLFTELGVFEHFDPSLPERYRDSEFVFLANIHPTLQLRVLEQARGPRFVAMDTMNFWIEGTAEELGRTLARVDGLVINDEEARQLTGETNLVLAAERIHELGPHTVIIKRGENGALLFDAAGVFFAPAFPLRDVRDPTGAGDSFAGGFLGYLDSAGAESPSAAQLRRAMAFGSVMASFNVEAFGTERVRALERAEIDERLARFKALTHFDETPAHA